MVLGLFNYNERRRADDIRILWPIIKERARDLDHARAAFVIHAAKDEAWRPLSMEEILRRIGELR
jgi:hypothetical protein